MLKKIIFYFRDDPIFCLLSDSDSSSILSASSSVKSAHSSVISVKSDKSSVISVKSANSSVKSANSSVKSASSTLKSENSSVILVKSANSSVTSVSGTRVKKTSTKRSDSPHSFKNFLKARDVNKDESFKLEDNVDNTQIKNIPDSSGSPSSSKRRIRIPKNMSDFIVNKKITDSIIGKPLENITKNDTTDNRIKHEEVLTPVTNVVAEIKDDETVTEIPRESSKRQKKIPKKFQDFVTKKKNAKSGELKNKGFESSKSSILSQSTLLNTNKPIEPTKLEVEKVKVSKVKGKDKLVLNENINSSDIGVKISQQNLDTNKDSENSPLQTARGKRTIKKPSRFITKERSPDRESKSSDKENSNHPNLAQINQRQPKELLNKDLNVNLNDVRNDIVVNALVATTSRTQDNPQAPVDIPIEAVSVNIAATKKRKRDSDEMSFTSITSSGESAKKPGRPSVDGSEASSMRSSRCTPGVHICTICSKDCGYRQNLTSHMKVSFIFL